MSKIDYNVLREAAEAAKGKTTWQSLQAFHAVVTPEVVLAMLDVLDAPQEAEPVAWMRDDADGREYNARNEFSDGGKGIPLYRVPPAPEVPEEIYWQDAPVEGSIKAAAYATGWNACRAAMLQGKGK